MTWRSGPRPRWPVMQPVASASVEVVQRHAHGVAGPDDRVGLDAMTLGDREEAAHHHLGIARVFLGRALGEHVKRRDDVDRLGGALDSREPRAGGCRREVGRDDQAAGEVVRELQRVVDGLEQVVADGHRPQPARGEEPLGDRAGEQGVDHRLA